MRATHKRFAGRYLSLSEAAQPETPRQQVSYYRSPPATGRGWTRRATRVIAVVVLALVGVVVAALGAAFLWFDQTVSALQAHSPALKRAERQLSVALPGQPTIALVLGDNQRAGIEKSAGGRSDTIMLIRADPATKTISLLSIPRDLQVPVYCPRQAQPLATTRIDYAFAYCGPAGSLETVHKLTGLPIDYLITVDFHGFKEIVNDLGGVWLDVDRSYYNKDVGTAATDYANINLQPGYQLLSGGSALEFVRFRHTDSDLYRLAREQEFLRALRDQVARNFDPLELPKIVSDIAQNVEVGSKHGFGDTDVLGWALFAVTLPAGHVFQNYISDVTGVTVGDADELTTSMATVRSAVEQFLNPDLGAARAAGDAALRLRARTHTTTPRPTRTTVTVLNGNGVAGAAAIASSLLARRGYRTALPAGGAAANAPSYAYVESRVLLRRAPRWRTGRSRETRRAARSGSGASPPADPRSACARPRLDARRGCRPHLPQ